VRAAEPRAPAHADARRVLDQQGRLRHRLTGRGKRKLRRAIEVCRLGGGEVRGGVPVDEGSHLDAGALGDFGRQPAHAGARLG
jgi:hypothetical protein